MVKPTAKFRIDHTVNRENSMTTETAIERWTWACHTPDVSLLERPNGTIYCLAAREMTEKLMAKQQKRAKVEVDVAEREREAERQEGRQGHARRRSTRTAAVLAGLQTEQRLKQARIKAVCLFHAHRKALGKTNPPSKPHKHTHTRTHTQTHTNTHSHTHTHSHKHTHKHTNTSGTETSPGSAFDSENSRAASAPVTPSSSSCPGWLGWHGKGLANCFHALVTFNLTFCSALNSALVFALSLTL